MMKEQQSQQYQSRLCKIVYFDEESVTDYIQIVKGGRLEKTTELLNETKDKGQAGVDAKASVGIGGVLKALVGLELKTNVDTELETSFNTNQMAKNILKNSCQVFLYKNSCVYLIPADTAIFVFLVLVLTLFLPILHSAILNRHF